MATFKVPPPPKFYIFCFSNGYFKVGKFQKFFQEILETFRSFSFQQKSERSFQFFPKVGNICWKYFLEIFLLKFFLNSLPLPWKCIKETFIWHQCLSSCFIISAMTWFPDQQDDYWLIADILNWADINRIIVVSASQYVNEISDLNYSALHISYIWNT